ncbi:antibiotic biosynthesis monooxygenase [Deinococcus radiodurans R1 = ATCC 13939 = DSM 20539]|uniref:ABM domain-containing protein n=4 Tax=Deinococcus radiodurans TaxID=1299 RepID=Q9RSM4_DEIRA|nr:conserved hypothetical protein [Deinococcus radiodurans R1 = ATCC 13939 = DSM 20539]QEM71488.1 antibiotic biosynthesis monooxygenase [Deinococcus radiodurans]UDL01135.1 antibiotic biosynthesis monooxygenase [Deinococcus radiodurans R1 = ATCC 13939 = DSM 20539]HCE63577.1 antibiotic biosynthesis monooxygenase [Deinococcus radiodurans]
MSPQSMLTSPQHPRRTTMVISHGTLSASAEHAAHLRQLLVHIAQATRQEDGCLLYLVSEDLSQPGHFLITEHWDNLGAMHTHLALPGVTQAIDALKHLNVTDLKITAYEAGEAINIMG